MHSLQGVLKAQLQRGPLVVLFMIAAGCAQEPPAPPNVAAASADLSLDGLAKQCKLECPAQGIAEGNASISGLASVDAFFQSVLDYQAKANNVSGAIDAQLSAIRGDFGLADDVEIGAALMAKISDSVEAGLTIDAEPASCTVDTEATIRAQAHCDASVQPGKVSCQCKGKCEVEASANVDCGAQAQLECTTNAPSVACAGSCQGTCSTQLDAAASCSGKCRGTCSGKCGAYARNAKGGLDCDGDCDAMCTGHCDVRVAAAAECKGMCDGECTVMPGNTSCEGGIRAQCTSMADAMVDCRGRCRGEIQPPKAKAECEATAKVEAKINVQCTPPRLAVKFKVKSTLEATASAQFVAAANKLEVRLPALFAAIAQASSVTTAQLALIGDGRTAVKNAISETLTDKSMLQAKVVGLTCALDQLDQVDTAVDTASKRLSASLDASTKLQAALMANNS